MTILPSTSAEPSKDLGRLLATDEPPRRKAPQGITTMEALQALDEAAMVRGYRAGLHNAADFSERDPGYWHVREWGFHCPRGWVHWKRFTASDDPGAVGKGCDA